MHTRLCTGGAEEGEEEAGARVAVYIYYIYRSKVGLISQLTCLMHMCTGGAKKKEKKAGARVAVVDDTRAPAYCIYINAY
jgi:hypothetical protein